MNINITSKRTHTHMRTGACTHTHTHAYKCTCTHGHAYTCIQAHTRTHIHTRTYSTHTHLMSLLFYRHTHTHAHRHTDKSKILLHLFYRMYIFIYILPIIIFTFKIQTHTHTGPDTESQTCCMRLENSSIYPRRLLASHWCVPLFPMCFYSNPGLVPSRQQASEREHRDCCSELRDHTTPHPGPGQCTTSRSKHDQVYIQNLGPGTTRYI